MSNYVCFVGISILIIIIIFMAQTTTAKKTSQRDSFKDIVGFDQPFGLDNQQNINNLAKVNDSYLLENGKSTPPEDIELSPVLKKIDLKHLKWGQTKMTDMLREFNRICRKYDLKYWCTGGTLIGILRHQGWIPWDGDIDVCMLDSDFKKLEHIIQKELPGNMWFQSLKTDKNYRAGVTAAKIRDINSCYLKSAKRKIKGHHGLQLDIFTYGHRGNRLIARKRMNDLKNYDYSLIFPLQEKYFEDVLVYIPNNYQKYSIINWKQYPPPLIAVSKRFPHEGPIEANRPCPLNVKHYPKLYQNRESPRKSKTT